MATTTTAGIDELIAVIHEPYDGLQEATRKVVEGFLNIIAEALLEGWYTGLEVLSDDYYDGNLEWDDIEADLLKVFRAQRATSGIMKTGVYINHQWVVKLGRDAVREATFYQCAGPTMLKKLIPTVPLGEFGNVQLKVKLPENSKGFGFDDPKIERQYSRMMSDHGDVHRGNVGIWKDKLMHLDFGGC